MYLRACFSSGVPEGNKPSQIAGPFHPRVQGAESPRERQSLAEPVMARVDTGPKHVSHPLKKTLISQNTPASPYGVAGVLHYY